MLRAINGLMGVISGLKLKKNEAGGVGGKRSKEKVPVMGSDGVLAAPSQVPHRSQMGHGHYPWSMLYYRVPHIPQT